MRISKEEIEFAQFACHEFADFGFHSLEKVQQKQIPYEQYIHDMLLLVLQHFQGDGEKSWRFLHYALDEKTVQDCEEYIVYKHDDCIKKGLIKIGKENGEKK